MAASVPNRRRGLTTRLLGIGLGVALLGGLIPMMLLGKQKPNGSDATWVQAAQRGRVDGKAATERALEGLAKLSAEKQQAAQALLDELSKSPPTGAGLAAGMAKLQEGLPGLASGRAGGTDPAVARVKQAALAVAHGLVAKGCETLASSADVASTTELLRTIKSLAGLSAQQQLGLISELRRGIPEPLFEQASQALAAAPAKTTP